MQAKYFITNSELKHVDYPVGRNIRKVAELATTMSREVRRLFPDNGMKQCINLWTRGSSGSIIGTALALDLNKFNYDANVVTVRKLTESSHSNGVYPMPSGLNIIVDDFICTGDTLLEIYKSFESWDIAPMLDAILVGGTICDTLSLESIEVKYAIGKYIDSNLIDQCTQLGENLWCNTKLMEETLMAPPKSYYYQHAPVMP